MRLYYAPQAATEVEALLAYIAERSPQGAGRIAARIQAAERTLMEHPHIGQMTNAHSPPVRRFVLTPYPYIVFYEVHEHAVMIIGVRHGARHPGSMPSGESP